MATKTAKTKSTKSFKPTKGSIRWTMGKSLPSDKFYLIESEAYFADDVLAKPGKVVKLSPNSLEFTFVSPHDLLALGHDMVLLLTKDSLDNVYTQFNHYPEEFFEEFVEAHDLYESEIKTIKLPTDKQILSYMQPIYGMSFDGVYIPYDNSFSQEFDTSFQFIPVVVQDIIDGYRKEIMQFVTDHNDMVKRTPKETTQDKIKAIQSKMVELQKELKKLQK